MSSETLCQGSPDVTVYAGDLNAERLAASRDLAEPLAEKNRVRFVSYNPKTDGRDETFNYIVLMVPVAALSPRRSRRPKRTRSSTSSPAFPPM